MFRFVDRLARVFALLGGLVLCALIGLTVLSVAGRVLNTALHGAWVQATVPGLAATLLGWGVGPVNGDFELVEAGMAFAIFAFLPLCQLHGAHATVDIFTAALPPRAARMLRAGIETVFAAVLVLIAWQLLQGTLSKARSGQTTLSLEYPVWWAYAASLTAAGAAALVAVVVAALRLRSAATGHPALPPDMETHP